MAKKVSSPHQKALYKEYETQQTWKKNKKTKLQRHINKYPNDTKAEKALAELAGKTAPSGPRRPGPKAGECRKDPMVLPKVEKPKTVADQLIELGFRRGRR